jgi:hypothetical protein
MKTWQSVILAIGIALCIAAIILGNHPVTRIVSESDHYCPNCTVPHIHQTVSSVSYPYAGLALILFSIGFLIIVIGVAMNAYHGFR